MDSIDILDIVFLDYYLINFKNIFIEVKINK